MSLTLKIHQSEAHGPGNGTRVTGKCGVVKEYLVNTCSVPGIQVQVLPTTLPGLYPLLLSLPLILCSGASGRGSVLLLMPSSVPDILVILPSPTLFIALLMLLVLQSSALSRRHLVCLASSEGSPGFIFEICLSGLIICYHQLAMWLLVT